MSPLTGFGPALPRRGACGPHRETGPETGWFTIRDTAGGLDLVFDAEAAEPCLLACKTWLLRRRFLPASHATRRVQRQGMNLFICNSFGLDLTDSVGEFLRIGRRLVFDWGGDFECNRDVSTVVPVLDSSLLRWLYRARDYGDLASIE